MKWEENVRRVEPYIPGEQPTRTDIIKLNTNESPYPPTPLVNQAKNDIEVSKMRLYPNCTAEPLVKELAQYYHLSEEEIFVGVGSDDVLATAFLTFFYGEEPVLFPDITYSFYDVWCDLYRIPYKRIPLDENFKIRPQDYDIPNGGIVLANPNAPTGIAESAEWIEQFLVKNPDVVVIVDEAYVDFGSESVLPLIHKYENLLVVQTFSKSRSMAGMRIGFAMGNKKMIKYLNDAKFSINSYTMNMPSMYYGVLAVQDEEYFRNTLKKVVTTRERMKDEFRKLGFEMTDSMTNFLFVKHNKASSKEIFEYLKEQGIFVRYFNKPRVDQYLRITIGTDEQMDQLVATLRAYLIQK